MSKEEEEDSSPFREIINGCIQSCFAAEQSERMEATKPPIDSCMAAAAAAAAALERRHAEERRLLQDEPLDLSVKPSAISSCLSSSSSSSASSGSLTTDAALAAPTPRPGIKPHAGEPLASPGTSAGQGGKVNESLLTNMAMYYASQASVLYPNVPLHQLQTFYREQLDKLLQQSAAVAAAAECGGSTPVGSVKTWLQFYQLLLSNANTSGAGVAAGGENGGHAEACCVHNNAQASQDERAESPVIVVDDAAVEREMIARKMQAAAPAPIPDSQRAGWWRLQGKETVRQTMCALHQRGIRERALHRSMQRQLDAVVDAAGEPSAPTINFDPPTSACVLKVRSRRGKGRMSRRDSLPVATSLASEFSTPGEEPEEAFVDECALLEEVEALEERILNASLQTKGWQAPAKVIDDKRITLIPASRKKTPGRLGEVYPLDLCRERMLDMEAHLERRYLLPPLNKEPQLDVMEDGSSASAHNPPTPAAPAGQPSTAGNLTPSSTPTSTPAPACEPGPRTANSAPPATADSVLKSLEPVQEMDVDESTSLSCASSSGTGGAAASARIRRQGALEGVMEEEDLPLGLIQWRQVTLSANTAAQLRHCLQQLESAIAWDKSIMRVLCQICRKDDNEAQLLLCDGCDRGYHTYCFKPAMTEIPDGEWFCFHCVSKATGRAHCTVCGRTTGRMASCDACSRVHHLDCLETPLARIPRRWLCSACAETSGGASGSAAGGGRKNASSSSSSSNGSAASQNNRKRPRGKTADEATTAKRQNVGGGGSAGAAQSNDSPKPAAQSGPECAKPTASAVETAAPAASAIVCNCSPEELERCKSIMEEMCAMKDSWPFLKPVNLKQVPFYRKIIKKPMDFFTVRKKLNELQYRDVAEFVADVRLVFDNCETFNEDESEIGHAGHVMRAFFEKRWANKNFTASFPTAAAAAISTDSSNGEVDASSGSSAPVTNNVDPLVPMTETGNACETTCDAPSADANGSVSAASSISSSSFSSATGPSDPPNPSRSPRP